MRRAYSALLYLALPLVLARLAWLGLGNREYWRRWTERFGFAPASPPDERPLWVHAVSVGEVQAARPLLERLRHPGRDCPVLVTTTTPTGAAMLARDPAGVRHCYFPYDLPDAIARFLARVRPCALVVMETEIWPNLFAACAGAGVPVVLANARMSARSAAGYRLVGQLTAATLRNVTVIAAQSDADAARLVALGAPPERVQVTGSVKFDARMPASLHERAAPLRREFGVNRPVLIAASTHAGEEEAVLGAWQQVRAALPEALLVLVPRHPERGTRVAELCRARGLRCVARSAGGSAAGVDVYLGDTLGELPLLYAAADVAFVGGSLVPVGGHNMLEPAALGLPVLTGPHTFNFAAVAATLKAAGALEEVADSAELATRLSAYLDDASLRARVGDAARAVVAANRGAIDRLEAIVGPLTAARPQP